MMHWSHRKLARADARGHFRTVDLFAGCGGMSLGFHRAGFACVAAVEIDESARCSHRANFERLTRIDEYAAHSNITELQPNACVNHLRAPGQRAGDVIDIVIGGPPCQAFSRLGRAALWDRAGRKDAHADDHRAVLYEHFLYYVAKLRPIAFVMENVPEIGRFHHKNIAEEIAATAEETLGYTTRYALLNSAWYGVPQLRERMFIIGIRRELEIVPTFPEIEYTCEIPTGYATSRAGTGHFPVLSPYTRFVDHFAVLDSVQEAVAVSEALQDLPKIVEHIYTPERIRRRDVFGVLPYSGVPSRYGRAMREWPEMLSNGGSSGHVIRLTPRDYEIFRRMNGGDMYPEALLVAEEIFKERRGARERVLGRELVEGSSDWTSLRKETVPPYKATRYPNKFRKMEPDRPARTVPAHLGKDCYSHIHYDSGQARTISVREAARLQSFPDAFQLCGSMNHQFTQIGNAVPPLLAYAVAKRLRNQLTGTLAE